MSQIDAAYSQPFPSPDHTYAISPAKEEREEAVKTEPPDPDQDQDQEETQPTYRGRVSYFYPFTKYFFTFSNF